MTESKTTQLKNILNTTMKTDAAKMANDEVYKLGFWPTGLLPIDAALGGGWAKGRMNLSAGESATLKSLIGLSTAAQVQRAGGTAAYIDFEHSFNPEWAEAAHVDTSNLILLQPETGEEAIDHAEVLIRNDIDYICVDSIAAMLPRADRDIQLSGKDNPQPARIASIMAIGLRKLNSANKKTCISWISQMRDNIGAMAFSPKTNITGGKAIHYYISQSLSMKKTGKVYDEVRFYNGQKDDLDKQIVQQQFKVEQTKSRFGQPFTVEHFVFDLRTGQVDTVGYLIQQGLMLGTIDKKGAWWTLSEIDSDGVILNEHKAGSKDKFYDLVMSEPVVQDLLLTQVCDKYSLDKSNYVWEDAVV